MPTNPHAAATDAANDALHDAFLQTGIVSSAPDGQSGGAHHVYVQETTTPVDGPVPVMPPVHGDYYIPPEGTPVVVGSVGDGEYFMLNSAVPRTKTPTLDAGERIVSHPLSGAAVHFRDDGTLDIYGDTTVRINGGDQGMITDVSAGSTNSNGGITSLDITRNSNILV